MTLMSGAFHGKAGSRAEETLAAGPRSIISATTAKPAADSAADHSQPACQPA